jgi:integrase
MSELRAAVEDYLAIRRKLGFSLKLAGRLLPDFVEYVQCCGAPHVTTAVALAWATQPTEAHPVWWRQRLGIVRGFARHLKTIDASTEVPPTDLLPAHRSRRTPFLYSDAEIAGLLGAARLLSPEIRAVTYETFIGLLSVTGLRLGEAIGLDRSDVDLAEGIIEIRHAKLDKPREVCLHDSTVDALRVYAGMRDLHWTSPDSPSFFVSARGMRLGQSIVHRTFAQLVGRAGLSARGERCSPRLHDLRHSFAVRTLLGWYRAGVDVDVKLPLLSTFLGHVDPAATYWYLQAAPELLCVVSQSLEVVLGELP